MRQKIKKGDFSMIYEDFWMLGKELDFISISIIEVFEYENNLIKGQCF